MCRAIGLSRVCLWLLVSSVSLAAYGVSFSNTIADGGSATVAQGEKKDHEPGLGTTFVLSGVYDEQLKLTLSATETAVTLTVKSRKGLVLFVR